MYNEFIDFFKKHNLYDERLFNHIRENTYLIHYAEEDKRPFIGYSVVTKNNILTDVKICVPIITDQTTLLINIYVYMYTLQLYKQLGKKLDTNKINHSLPLFYQELYLQENPNSMLQEHLKELDNLSMEKGTEKDKAALKVKDELLNYYNQKQPSLTKLEKKAKKLTKKYSK